MKVVILMLTVISAINCAAMPTVGTFFLTGYTDSKCTISNTLTPGAYTGDKKCWATGTTNSVAATAWDATTKKLTLSGYAKDAECKETPVPTAADIACDGSCLASTLDTKLFYTCLYINIPKEGSFYMTGFTENTCKTAVATAPGAYNGKNLCWVTGAKKSMVPLSWDATTSTLNAFAFGSVADCRGDTKNTAAGPIKCDGTCLQDALDKTMWYNCVYVNLPDGKYTLSPFTDKDCATKGATAPGVYDDDKACWATGDKTSLFPLKYDATTKKLTVYTFAASSACTGDRTASLYGDIPCDGTCQLDGANKTTYYTCKMTTEVKDGKASYLIGSIMLLLTVFLL